YVILTWSAPSSTLFPYTTLFRSHSKVEYIVAHGISSHINGKKVVIGSSHFVFDDEACQVRPEYRDRFESLPDEYSHLYLAIEQEDRKSTRLNSSHVSISYAVLCL